MAIDDGTRRCPVARRFRRALCLSVLCLLVGCQTPPGRPGVVPDTSDADRRCLEAHWQGIRNWQPEKPYEDYDDKALWWVDVILSSYEHIWLACYQVGPETAMPFFVRQFGQHGAEVDFRLLLGAPELMLPQHYDQPAEIWRPSNAKMRRARKLMREAQLATAKAQVELFLEDFALLDRYYKAVVWSEVFFGNPDYHHLNLLWKYASLRDNFPR